jgi:hypothetical protein
MVAELRTQVRESEALLIVWSQECFANEANSTPNRLYILFCFILT